MPRGHPILFSAATPFAAIHFLFSHAREHRASHASRKARSHPSELVDSPIDSRSASREGLNTMRRFLPLLLCLSLSIFALARAMKPTDILVSCAQGARQSPMKANTNTFLNHPITEQEPGSNDNENDNDNTQDPSGNEGEEATSDGGDAAADQDTGDDDGADDNVDDDGGDSSSDNGGQ